MKVSIKRDYLVSAINSYGKNFMGFINCSDTEFMVDDTELDPVVANNDNIHELVLNAILLKGNYADLNFIDVSQVTNMSKLFEDLVYFNGNISNWDTSNVTNMSFMFSGCYNFNQPLYLDTSKVTDMRYFLEDCCSYNQDLKLNTSNVKIFRRAFAGMAEMNSKININFKNCVDTKEMFLYMNEDMKENITIHNVNNELLKMACKDARFKLY